MHEAIRVADSSHGLGVFAILSFPAESLVGWMVGQRILDPEYSSPYGVDLGDGTTLEPEAPFRYLNHACDPNCALYVVGPDESGAGGHPTVCIETLREIAPGEELTIDYGWPADGAIRCACRSSNCRGWIVSVDELPLLDSTPQPSAAV